MKLTITHNGFHGETRIKIIVDGKPGDIIDLTDSQVKRLSRAACGVADCQCGETMLRACYDWDYNYEPRLLQIPESGDKINVTGRYHCR